MELKMKKPEFRLWGPEPDEKTKRKHLPRFAERVVYSHHAALEQLQAHAPDSLLASKMAICIDHLDDARTQCIACSEGCPLGMRCYIGADLLAKFQLHPSHWMSAAGVFAHPADRVKLGHLHEVDVKTVLTRLHDMTVRLNTAFGPFAVSGIVAPEVRPDASGEMSWQLTSHLLLSHENPPAYEDASKVMLDGLPSDGHAVAWADYWSFWDWEAIAPIPFGVSVRHVVKKRGEALRYATPLTGAAAAEYTLWLDAHPEADACSTRRRR
jgi:hypothetical protein